MAGFPRLEFPSEILTTGFAQLGHDLRILGGQPVLQFIKRFDRRQYRYGNLNSVLGHMKRVLGRRAKASIVSQALLVIVALSVARGL